MERKIVSLWIENNDFVRRLECIIYIKNNNTESTI